MGQAGGSERKGVGGARESGREEAAGREGRSRGQGFRAYPLASKGEHVRVLGDDRRHGADPKQVRDLGVRLVRRHHVQEPVLTQRLRSTETRSGRGC